MGRAKWEIVGSSNHRLGNNPGTIYRARGFRTPIPKGQFTTSDHLKHFRRVQRAFYKVVDLQRDPEKVFDLVGDPNHETFLEPIRDLSYICICDEIECYPASDGVAKASERRACFQPRANARRLMRTSEEPTLFITREGLESPRVLFEEIAHAHKRMVPGKSHLRRYLCHLHILKGLMQSLEAISVKGEDLRYVLSWLGLPNPLAETGHCPAPLEPRCLLGNKRGAAFADWGCGCEGVHPSP